MTISMIGIDHGRAPVDIRALFAFTKKNAGEAMEQLKEKAGIHGCVILSTCNRLEIWASHEEEEELSLYQCLCELKGIQDGSYEDYFITRRDREAVNHLFHLAGGLKSQILGEDQILTQIKDALNLAREHFASDSVLEVLFRMAATVGKKIKTEAPLAHGNPSVIHQALSSLKEQGYETEGKTCMVIGNGEMGKVAAQTLRENGGDVTVTVRQYRSGIVEIPEGCKRIHYGERMEYLPKCDFVVSATASPNFTLRAEDFVQLTLERPLILLDLAVPRDIDPALSEIEGIALYDMDSFHSAGISPEQKESIEKADRIVQAQLEEFYQWLEGRDVIPRIQEIKADAVEDLNLRIEKILKKTPMEQEDRQKLLEAVDTAAGKVVNKLIFGLRDCLNQETFLECVAGLEKLYEE